jgi:hypothetical protein
MLKVISPLVTAANEAEALREERDLWEWAAIRKILPQEHPTGTWDGEHRFIVSYHGEQVFGNTPIESLRALRAEVQNG